MSRYERNFYGKLKQASVVSWCAFKDNFVSLGIQAKSVGRTLAKLEWGEKSESGRKVVKLPVSARRRLLRQSCDRVGGACEEAGIKVQNDQEFASTGWSPSLTKYMENTKSYSCQTLPNSLHILEPLYIKLMEPDLCKQLQFVRTLSLFASQKDLNVVFSWEL